LRKLAIVAAGTTLALGALAPAAQAGPTSFELDVRPTSSVSGSTANPRFNGLRTTFRLNPAGDYAAQSASVFLDRNFRFNNRRFRTCAEATVKTTPTRCPRGSRVGSGRGTAVTTLTSPPSVSPLAIQAFNGPGNKLFIRVSTNNPIDIVGVMVGTLRPASGRFGRRLAVQIPRDLYEPLTDVHPTLTEFVLNIRATFRGRPYIETRGCSARRWNFRADLTFTDGTSATDADTAACRRGR
jgi:hypothetical protein